MHWKRKYDNYNCSAFYESSYVIARAYQNGRFSFGGRDKMKKKNCVDNHNCGMHSIRISKCLSVQGDTEQRRPDCMEPNDRGSDVSGYSGTHTGGDFIFTNM